MMLDSVSNRTNQALQQSTEVRQRLQQVQQQLQGQYDNLQEKERNLAKIEKPERAAHPKSPGAYEGAFRGRRASMSYEAEESTKVLNSLRDLSEQIEEMESRENHLQQLQAQYERRRSSTGQSSTSASP